jgi:hypothetical protein
MATVGNIGDTPKLTKAPKSSSYEELDVQGYR